MRKCIAFCDGLKLISQDNERTSGLQKDLTLDLKPSDLTDSTSGQETANSQERVESRLGEGGDEGLRLGLRTCQNRVLSSSFHTKEHLKVKGWGNLDDFRYLQLQKVPGMTSTEKVFL